MTYKILVLPVATNDQLFESLWDNICNTLQVDVESEHRTGNPTDLTLIGRKVFHETQKPENQRARRSDKLKHVEVAGEQVLFNIHPDSGITQQDIDDELAANPDHAFGNGMSTVTINDKTCVIIVMQKNKDVTPAKLNQIRDEFARTV